MVDHQQESKRKQRLKDAQRRAKLYGTCRVGAFPKTERRRRRIPHDRKSSNNSAPESSKVSSKSAPWKMGFCATPSSYKATAMGIGGLLEPSEGVKKRMLLSDTDYKRVSRAYPPLPKSIVKATVLTPQDWKSHELALRNSINDNDDDGTKPRWSPTKAATVKGYGGTFDFVGFETKISRPASAAAATTTTRRQQTTMYDIHGRKKATLGFPLRNQRGRRPATAGTRRKVDERFAKKESRDIELIETALENRCKQVPVTYHGKTPAGIATATRSYRRGIDPYHAEDVPANYVLSESVRNEFKKIPVLRPTSALPTAKAVRGVPKVAGALSRPKSAQFAQLRTSMVCITTPKSEVEIRRSVKNTEDLKKRRASMLDECLTRVCKAKALSDAHIPAVFAVLRSQAVLNFPQHMRLGLDSVSWTTYLKRRMDDAPPLALPLETHKIPSIAISTVPQEDEEDYIQQLFLSGEDGDDLSPPKVRVKNNAEPDSAVERMLNEIPDLWIRRDQFIMTMDSNFEIPIRDLNLLYSSFDIDAVDRVDVGKICASMAKKQVELKTLVF